MRKRSATQRFGACHRLKVVSSAHLVSDSLNQPGIPLVPLRGVLSISLMATEEELKAEIARLRAENQAMQRPTRGQMSLKVSEKGALSVYGLGRFPVTLYREQWEKLLGMADEIRAFIQENDGV